MTHNRKEIMKHAHRLRRERGLDMSSAMKEAWRLAKQTKPVTTPVTRPLILPPVVQAAMGTYALARRIATARSVEIGVRVQIGARLIDRDGVTSAWVGERSVAGGYEARQ